MNNKNRRYCSPSNNGFYQASYKPEEPTPRATENRKPAPQWGCDESFAALSAATRKAEKAKKLSRINAIPNEVWEAIARANEEQLDEEDAQHVEPIHPKELYRTKPSKRLPTEQEYITGDPDLDFYRYYWSNRIEVKNGEVTITPILKRVRL